MEKHKEHFHLAVFEGGILTPLCVSCTQSEADRLADSLAEKDQLFTKCGGNTLDGATTQAVWLRKHGFKAIVMQGSCPAQGDAFSRYYPVPQAELEARHDHLF